jgi:hypothetical protein
MGPSMKVSSTLQVSSMAKANSSTLKVMSSMENGKMDLCMASSR